MGVSGLKTQLSVTTELFFLGFKFWFFFATQLKMTILDCYISKKIIKQILVVLGVVDMRQLLLKWTWLEEPTQNLKWFTLRTNRNLFDPNLDPEGPIPLSPNWTNLILWPNLGPLMTRTNLIQNIFTLRTDLAKIEPEFWSNPTLNPTQPYKMTALI